MPSTLQLVHLATHHGYMHALWGRSYPSAAVWVERSLLDLGSIIPGSVFPRRALRSSVDLLAGVSDGVAEAGGAVRLGGSPLDAQRAESISVASVSRVLSGFGALAGWCNQKSVV